MSSSSQLYAEDSKYGEEIAFIRKKILAQREEKQSGRNKNTQEKKWRQGESASDRDFSSSVYSFLYLLKGYLC